MPASSTRSDSVPYSRSGPTPRPAALCWPWGTTQPLCPLLMSLSEALQLMMSMMSSEQLCRKVAVADQARVRYQAFLCHPKRCLLCVTCPAPYEPLCSFGILSNSDVACVTGECCPATDRCRWDRQGGRRRLTGACGRGLLPGNAVSHRRSYYRVVGNP